MSLTDTAIKNAKPKEKDYVLSDLRGLMLFVRPSGTKSWVVRCYENNKEFKRTIGTYPEMTLVQARAECLRIKAAVKDGTFTDREKTVDAEAEIDFLGVYDEWYKVKIAPLSKNYSEKIRVQLNKHVIPFIGEMPISAIKSPDILALCRRLERLSTDTAHRVRQFIGQIFRFAIAAGYTESDPTYALRGALAPHKKKHYPTITDTPKIGLLIRSIDEYPYDRVRIAMQFSILTFCRPGEIRQAEWNEIDMEKKQWEISAQKMKMGRKHIVPLSKQVIKLLDELRPLTENLGKWLFPSERRDGRPMSDGTVRLALRAMGYSQEEITAHSFRGMASTILNEHGFPPDVIERQLAHSERNEVRAAYNHAEYLPERRKMMQWWADWLGALK